MLLELTTVLALSTSFLDQMMAASNKMENAANANDPKSGKLVTEKFAICFVPNSGGVNGSTLIDAVGSRLWPYV